MIMRYLLFLFAGLVISDAVYSQSCCSGGSGSPIAGGTSQGVLVDRQAEISLSFQYINSNKFLTGDQPSDNFLDNYNSKYLYTRFAYGLTSKLTLSLETGYYFNKTQVGLKKRDTITSKGFGDFIIFPRYSIYTRNTEKTRDEITIGLGMKIPIGKYLDSSVVYTDPSGKDFYTPKPPAVMQTTGSNDFIFYGFLYRGYPEKKARIFTSLLYVKKGWNRLGQRFGDYASIGLFAGKTYFKDFGVTLQLKGEWVDGMDYDHNIDMLAKYNLDVNSTGGKRLLFVPQVSYNFKSFSMYLLTEIPLYQYVNGTGIASQYLFTLGFSYRFMTYKEAEE
jgi:hypothetical protein